MNHTITNPPMRGIRIAFGLILFACLIIVSQTSHAGIAYSIDVDNSMAGIQDTRPAMANDQVVADVILVLDGATTLGNYAVSLGFDTTELQFVSGTENAPGTLSSFNPITVSSTDASVLVGIEAGSFADSVGTGTYNIASLTFNVLTPVGDATDIDLTLFEDPILDGSFDGFNQLTPTFNNASITVAAVPEPSSLLVYAMILGMMTRRPKRRNRTS